MLTNARPYRMAGPAIALGIIVANACSEGREPTADRPVAALQKHHVFDYAEEAPVRQLARQIPSLGGWYFDTATGNLVVYMKDFRNANAAKAALNGILGHDLAKSRRRHPQADIVFREAGYTWLQLKEWRDLVREVMPTLSGITSLDLDEVRNRVVIGLDYGYNPAAVHSLVSNLGIPEAAVEIEIAGPLVPFTTVRDKFRPYLGGVQTQWINDVTFEIHLCSLGFNALTSLNEKVFVTSSHCSKTHGVADGTFTFQNVVAFDSLNPTFIGQEVADYGVAGCGNELCTFADAALYSAHTSTEWVLGRIAHTSCACFGSPCNPAIDPCMIEIYSTIPYFTINAVRSSYNPGDYVFMVGATTGTTEGNVTKTCTTVRGDGLFRDCQVLATFVAGEGDSGGPVFLDWSNAQDQTVTLGGVIVGGYQGKVAFSPWSGIVMNYPGLTAF